MAVVKEDEKLVPQARVQQPTVEQVPVPQFLGETVEVVLAPTERVQRRSVDVPMSQVLEETVEVQILNEPQFAEEIVEVSRLVPRERVHQRKAVQIGNVPQYPEETVETVRFVPHERVQWIDEQMARQGRVLG